MNRQNKLSLTWLLPNYPSFWLPLPVTWCMPLKVLVFCLFRQKTLMKTTWGVLDPPVGNTRLNVVRLVASLLQTNTHIINQELINLNTLGVILVSGLNGLLWTQILSIPNMLLNVKLFLVSLQSLLFFKLFPCLLVSCISTGYVL